MLFLLIGFSFVLFLFNVFQLLDNIMSSFINGIDFLNAFLVLFIVLLRSLQLFVIILFLTLQVLGGFFIAFKVREDFLFFAVDISHNLC